MIYRIILSLCSFFVFPMSVQATFYFETQKDILFDSKKKTAFSAEPFYVINDTLRMSANSFMVHYITLDSIEENLKQQSFINFKRIEAKGNVKLINLKNHGELKGEVYIFDVLKNIMIITSVPKVSIYEDEKYWIRAQDRFEYNLIQNIVVIRGNPLIKVKDIKQKQGIMYTIRTKLAYAQLNQNKELEYIEAFDNIVIQAHDGSTITGDYGNFNQKENIISLEDNIVVTDVNHNRLKGCKLLLDIESGDTKLIPCNDTFNTIIKINSKSKSK